MARDNSKHGLILGLGVTAFVVGLGTWALLSRAGRPNGHSETGLKMKEHSNDDDDSVNDDDKSDDDDDDDDDDKEDDDDDDDDDHDDDDDDDEQVEKKRKSSRGTESEDENYSDEGNEGDESGEEGKDLRAVETITRDALAEYRENMLPPSLYSVELQNLVKAALTFGGAGEERLIQLFDEDKGTSVFAPVLAWMGGMTSQEHRAAMHLLNLIIRALPRLKGLVIRLKPALVCALRFFIACSPDSVCPRTQVKVTALRCVQFLVKHNIVTEEEVNMNDYGNDFPPSPGLVLMRDLPNDLLRQWDAHWAIANDTQKEWMHDLDKKAKLNRLKEPPDVDEHEMYSMMGKDHPPPKVWTRTGWKDGPDELEVQRIKAANTVLKDSWKAGGRFQLSVEAMMKLHTTFNVDEEVEKSTYRQAMTVGSFHFYQQYRVFLPHQEIPMAMEELVRTFHCDAVRRLHPVMQAYYYYSALVYFIHPFEDGNGRMARLMSNLILRTFGYDFALNYLDKVVTVESYIGKVLDTWEPP